MCSNKSEGQSDLFDGLDPAPRSYAQGVRLLRRSIFSFETDQSVKPGEIETWMLGAASKTIDTTALTEGFAERLARSGLGVARLSLNVGTLHPQAFGYGWNWSLVDGFCDEIQIGEEALLTDAYRKNPLYDVMEFGKEIRVNLLDEGTIRSSRLLSNLAEDGFTDYLALPLSASCQRFNAITLATLQSEGFRENQITTLKYLLKLFALHVERHIASRISENISHTYLGREAGEQVVRGTIKRGAGVPINAIVWSSDMRDFSGLTEALASHSVTEILNAYFSALSDAVMGHGGDVLKFIGDGMLAVFPLADFKSPRDAALASTRAARAALSQLSSLNAEMAASKDWIPLKTGIGLHVGEVLFGNIGAAKRLDFTVIGEAVNIASRIEGYCKPLDRSVLLSEGVAALLGEGVEPMGEVHLKGMKKPEQLFALPQQD